MCKKVTLWQPIRTAPGLYRNVEASREVVTEGGETTNVLVLD